MRNTMLLLALLVGCSGGKDDDGTDTETPTGEDTGTVPTTDTETPPTGTETETETGTPPTTDPGEATIGASGGTLALGQVALEVPSGALAADTVLTVAEELSPADPTGVVAAWDFGPDGLQFAVPATLSVDGVATPATGERLTLSWYDEVAAAWVDLPTTVDGSVASAPVEHFTTFALRTVSIDAGECEGLPAPCGGDLVGTWQLDALCYEFAETKGTSTSGCDIVADFVVDASGSVTFDAGGTYTSQLVLDITANTTMPASCFVGLPAMDCGVIQPGCVGTTDVGCSCVQTFTETTDDLGTWTTAGAELVFDGDPTPSTYCVTGDDLVLWEPPEEPDDALATYLLSR